MLFRHRALRPIAAAILLAASWLTLPVHAVTKFWDTSTNANSQPGNGIWDTGTTALWSLTTGTTGGTTLTTWSADDDASFVGAGSSTVTINAGDTILLGNLTNSLNTTSNGATTIINGGTLQVDGTGITNIASANGTSLTINSAVVLNNTVTFNAGANITVGGAISEMGGSRAVTKSGGGTLTLNGANSWTGGTTITGGVLRFGTSSTIPTGSILINAAGTLAAAGPSGFTTVTSWLTSGLVSNTSTGTIGLTASTSENLDMSAAGLNYNNLYLGAVNNATYSGTLTPGTGGYLLGGGGAILTVSSALTASTSLKIATSTTGTVILTNAGNSFTGPISIGANGILQVTSLGALGNETSITTTAGGTSTLQLNGTSGDINVVGKTITINGTGVSSVGALSSVGGNNTWAGNVILGSTAARIGNATLSGTTFTISGVISDGGQGFDLAIRNTNGSTSTVLLSGANTYRGNTQIVVGILQLGANNTLPNVTSVIMGNSAGQGTTVLDLNGFNQTVAGVASVAVNAIAANVINSSATTSTLTITVNGATATSNQGSNAPKIVAFGGTGNNFNLTKSGTGSYTLFGAHTYTGATTVNGGTLVEDFNFATGITGTGVSFTNNLSTASNLVMAGGTFQVKGHANGTVTSTTGSWAINSTVVSVTTTNLAVGQSISGAGIPAGAYIVSILSGTQVLISAATTVAGAAGSSLTLGANDGTTSQTLNGLTVNAGANVIDVSLNTGTSVTLDLRGTSGTQGITRTVGGTVDFKASTGTFAGNAVVQTAQTNDPTGVIGTYATVNGTDWAANDGTGKIVAYTGYADINATGSDFTAAGLTANSNARINAAGPGSPVNSLGGLAGSTTNFNSLVQNTNTASTLDMTSQTLRLGAVGGIMIGSGRSSLTLGSAVNAGSLTAGGPNDNTAGELVFINNSTAGAANAIIVNATIVDNGTGAVTVTKSGAGDLQLVSTSNTYTGKTYLNGGITKIFGEGATSGSLGAVPLTAQADNLNFNGGTLQFNSAFNLNANRGITTSGNGAIIDTQALSITYAGNITGSGPVTKTGSGTGGGTLTLSGTGSDYTGLTTVSVGTLNITTANALGSASSGTTVANGASLSFSGGLTLAEPFSIAGGGTTGADGALHSISGNNTLNGNIVANTTVITRIVADSGQLTINGNVSSSATGSVANGFVFQGNGTILMNGVISGGTPVTRSSTGTGTAILAAVNTYSGITTISNGTIQVGLNGVGTTGSAAVAVNAGTLAGSGIVNGLATIASGASLSPGDTSGTSVGTLTFANGLTFNSTGGANVKMDLGSSSDLILLTGGTFTSNNTGLTTFNVTPGAGFGNGIYNLIDWSSLSVTPTNVDLADFAVTGLTGGLTGTFQFDGTGRILQLAVTPEPAHFGLLGMGLLALVWRRRRAAR